MYLSQPRWDPQEAFFSLIPMREERSVIPTHTNIQLILSMLKRNEERGHIPELRITDLDRFRQTAGKTLEKMFPYFVTILTFYFFFWLHFNHSLYDCKCNSYYFGFKSPSWLSVHILPVPHVQCTSPITSSDLDFHRNLCHKLRCN